MNPSVGVSIRIHLKLEIYFFFVRFPAAGWRPRWKSCDKRPPDDFFFFNWSVRLCLQATCERGLVAMEDCHLRVVEELQRLHQQEVEGLLVERERLLQEESAATATGESLLDLNLENTIWSKHDLSLLLLLCRSAIEAIKSAHREELQREIQRRSRPQNTDGNTQLEEIHR